MVLTGMWKEEEQRAKETEIHGQCFEWQMELVSYYTRLVNYLLFYPEAKLLVIVRLYSGHVDLVSYVHADD